MVRNSILSMVSAVVVMGVMTAQAPAQAERDGAYPEQLDEVGAGLGAQRHSLDQEAQRSSTMTLAAASVGGAKYFSTYQAAASFARSISGGYYTSITKSGRMYRVDYWAKDSHG